ncbi:MAG TPA: macro domain-containing protein [Stellaceae bacterium]|nr:macro domain-containing protein [Stellaceae bacterium]
MIRVGRGVAIDCVRGDIARQSDIECIVNAANAELVSGGGVAGAIHRAAGPGLAEECRSLAPIRPGQAVITGGHALPNRYVVHCLGPVWGRDEPADALLASCYRNALALAEQKGVISIAFPAISTGVFGFPLERAAAIALGTVLDAAERLRTIEHIRFVLFGEDDHRIHVETLRALAGERER